MGPLRVVVLFALYCLSVSAVLNGNNDTILDTCKTAPFVNLCVQTLTTAVEVNKTDLHGLGPAMACLQAAAQNGANTSAFISKTLEKMDIPAVLQCFNDCSKNYIDAVAQVEDSVAALDSEAFSDVNRWVAAAVSVTQSCQEGCKGLDGMAPQELMRRNTEFTNLCRNALAITKSFAT